MRGERIIEQPTPLAEWRGYQSIVYRQALVAGTRRLRWARLLCAGIGAALATNRGAMPTTGGGGRVPGAGRACPDSLPPAKNLDKKNPNL